MTLSIDDVLAAVRTAASPGTAGEGQPGAAAEGFSSVLGAADAATAGGAAPVTLPLQ